MPITNLKDLPSKQKITCGNIVLAIPVRVDDEVFTGYLGIENSSDGGLVPVIYLSDTEGGKPIKAMYGPEGKRMNAAKAKGVGMKINFTTGRKTRQAQVKLERGKVYWLCHELKAFGGVEPTATSSFIRSCSVSDAP